MRIARFGVFVVALLAAGAVGFAIGRARPLPEKGGGGERRPRSEPNRTVQLRSQDRSAKPAAASPRPRGHEGCGDEAHAPLPTSGNIDELLATLEARSEDELFHPGAVDQAIEHLLQYLSTGDAALARLLQKFRTTGNDAFASLLAVALGMTRHPEVERVAIELALVGATDNKRLAGLELLDRLDTASPSAIRALVKILTSETDPEVLGAAVYALHRDAVPPSEIESITSSLKNLMSNSDPEVRRRASIALAQWARDEADLTPIVTALSDSSPDVRAGAAFALSESRVTSAAAARALADRIADPNEDWDVREQCWHALRTYQLSDARLYQVYADFRKELETRPREASDEH